MSNPHIALVLAAVLLLVPFTGIASADGCVVADPTGTPLNVRKRPSQHAPIIGALNNGITVSMPRCSGRRIKDEGTKPMKPAQFVANANASGPSSGKPENPAVANSSVVNVMQAAGGTRQKCT
jgi:hypothetical protein